MDVVVCDFLEMAWCADLLGNVPAALFKAMGGFATNDGYADQLEGQMVSIKLSMDLVWRSLGVWATVLAILLLVDVIA